MCWASNTQSRGYRATYQNDGNFVVYNRSGAAQWASHTVGGSGENININRVGRIYVGQQPISGTCA